MEDNVIIIGDTESTVSGSDTGFDNSVYAGASGVDIVIESAEPAQEVQQETSQSEIIQETVPPDDVVIVDDTVQQSETIQTEYNYSALIQAMIDSMTASHELEEQRYDTFMTEFEEYQQKQDINSNNNQLLLTGILLAVGLVFGALVVKTFGGYFK